MAQLYCCQKHGNKTFNKHFFNEQTLVEDSRGAAAAQGVPVGVQAEAARGFWWRFAGDNILQCQNCWAPCST